MRVGISLSSSHRVEDLREGARVMIDRARAAERASLDSLFVGDHHATPFPYYQNSPMLGRLLAEWGARPAGALYLLPLWHPLLLAEQIGTLAALARDRFILQCAIGPDDAQFPAMGVSARERRSRFEESLVLLRRLLAGEVVTSSGHWSLREARVSPTPPEPVEVWIGAMAPAAIDRAARLGDAWLAAPALPAKTAGEQLRLYRERREAAGLDPGRATIRRDVYVGANAGEAEALAGPIARRGHRGFPPEALVYGDVAAVAGAFAELAELGFEDVIVRSLVPEQDAALASIGRLGEVRERLR